MSASMLSAVSSRGAAVRVSAVRVSASMVSRGAAMLSAAGAAMLSAVATVSRARAWLSRLFSRAWRRSAAGDVYATAKVLIF